MYLKTLKPISFESFSRKGSSSYEVGLFTVRIDISNKPKHDDCDFSLVAKTFISGGYVGKEIPMPVFDRSSAFSVFGSEDAVRHFNYEPECIEVEFKVEDSKKAYLALTDFVSNAIKECIEDTFFEGHQKAVICTDENNNPVGFYNSIAEAGEALGIASHSKISAVCNGKLTSTNGYRFYYGTRHDFLAGKVKLNTATMRTQHGGKIEQILNGNVIKVFDSVSDAARSLGVPTSHISAVCKGKRNSAFGYSWRYADETA